MKKLIVFEKKIDEFNQSKKMFIDLSLMMIDIDER